MPDPVPVAKAADRTTSHADAGTAEVTRARLVGALLGVLRLGPLLILLILIVALANLSPVFFTPQNLGNVLTQSAAIAILAIGQL
ncbi:MAG: hypothetical protein ABI566_10270, partial [Pseudolysinimonas sp.]